MDDMIDHEELLKEQTRERILHILSVYPQISPTMLQGGLGPQTKPEVWRPVLKELIDDGSVVSSEDNRTTPAGRYHSYQILQLAEVFEE